MQFVAMPFHLRPVQENSVPLSLSPSKEINVVALLRLANRVESGVGNFQDLCVGISKVLDDFDEELIWKGEDIGQLVYFWGCGGHA